MTFKSAFVWHTVVVFSWLGKAIKTLFETSASSGKQLLEIVRYGSRRRNGRKECQTE